MISIDTVRCPECEDIVLATMPSQELDAAEYHDKLHKHYRDAHPDLMDATGWA